MDLSGRSQKKDDGEETDKEAYNVLIAYKAPPIP